MPSRQDRLRTFSIALALVVLTGLLKALPAGFQEKIPELVIKMCASCDKLLAARVLTVSREEEPGEKFWNFLA